MLVEKAEEITIRCQLCRFKFCKIQEKVGFCLEQAVHYLNSTTRRTHLGQQYDGELIDTQ